MMQDEEVVALTDDAHLNDKGSDLPRQSAMMKELDIDAHVGRKRSLIRAACLLTAVMGLVLLVGKSHPAADHAEDASDGLRVRPPSESQPLTEPPDDLRVRPPSESQPATKGLTSPPIISKAVKAKHARWSKKVYNVNGLDLYPRHRAPDVHWKWHPRKRSQRFPSVEERIEYYMGKWFNTSVPLYGKEFRDETYIYQRTTREYQTHATVMVNLYGLSPEALYEECYQKKDHQQKDPNAEDCFDTIELAILHSEGTTNVLEHVGDGVSKVRVQADKLYPTVGKVRIHCEVDPLTNEFFNKDCLHQRAEHILWPLTRKRHFTPVVDVLNSDRPWEKKRTRISWRGHLHLNKKRKSNILKMDLVANYINSSVVDAKFGMDMTKKKWKKDDLGIPNEYISDYTSMEEQLRNKYLISIDGNDVATGLKWMLFSNSLLFLPGIGFESWAMEGLLEPFVHFVPLKSDMSDVEEKVQWAESHPQEAQKIAERGSLFIYDLLFHPDAQHEEELVVQGIMERFEQNFGYSTTSREVHPLFVHRDWHPKHRSGRFPSVEERVEYYMGKWYAGENEVSMERKMKREGFKHPRVSDSIFGQPELEKEIMAEGKSLSECALGKGSFSSELRQYCRDALPDFDERNTIDVKGKLNLKEIHHKKLAPVSSLSGESDVPKQKRFLFDDSVKFVRFGDGTTEWTDIPVFVKAREAVQQTKRVGPSILWEFDYQHEFALVQSGVVEENDIPFLKKVPRAVWRGGYGAKVGTSTSSEFKNRYDMVRLSVDGTKKLIDALFTVTHEDLSHRETNQTLPADMIDPTLVKEEDSEYLRWALSFRYLIALEDNFRINSSLKWMLLSRSVVLMPDSQKFTSWFMEDQLEPYVHYVPISSDYTDVEQKVKWCEEHSAEAQKISERSTLFVHDMLFDKSADRDNSEVKFRIMERYADLYNR